jgi:uncharacterized protein YbaP (TraB family)
MYKPLLKVSIIALLLLVTFSAFSQKKQPHKKYPSLLWEITGNGLKKPSYLFGTMHVSSKLVFHLSDSFYYALKTVDEVSLELNPDVWQGQMVNLDKMKLDYGNYVQAAGGDYINENSFRINKYDDELKLALSSEPTVVNSLLYRSYQTKQDFEENTFLDLYIFQTAKKLGKLTTGVENYYEAEKMVLEAYGDMALDKNKKTFDGDGESREDIEEKTQDAYRQGNLDLMDSLDILVEQSMAFREKFLYKRSEIQANSIDTILQKHSLFVGVGAAHLPGNRGVIELLRKKGYKLRPVKMADYDATEKETVDKLKVPVVFSKRVSDDGFYSVDMPGPLYKLRESNQPIDRRQYSDMSNGAYYIVSRVKTHSAFLGQNEEIVSRKVDSLLYENIPGKILKQITIEKNGYKGFDITNRTRRGDIQRYNIFITPFEVIIFKMSGNEDYVEGKEGDQFFSSIQLKRQPGTPVLFTPKQGGFSIQFPQAPSEHLNTIATDYINRWEYESIDKATGDNYLVLKKSIYNFGFLENDSFDLKLIEESFQSPDLFDKQLKRKLSTFNGYPCLDVKEQMKDGSIVSARYLIKGPDYYVIAARSKNIKKAFTGYLNSFRFTPYQSGAAVNYTDTFYHFSVTTPVILQMDTGYRTSVEKVTRQITESNRNTDYSANYWPIQKNACFRNDSTGELIGVSLQKYPKYYYISDAPLFWKNQMNDYIFPNDLILYKNDSFHLSNGITGFKFVLRDTGSSRTITRTMMLKDDWMFSFVTLGDTLSQPSAFVKTFFQTFMPEEKKIGRNLFDVNCLDSFFTDLFSKDTAIHQQAQQSIPNVYFGAPGGPKILAAINRLKPSDKDYYDTKEKLITELGYIKDTTNPFVVTALKKIYDQTADTSIFQNQVVNSLILHKTADAYKLLKELMLQDPPIFDNDYDYTNLFSGFQDSLALSSTLYPDFLQLGALDDYKEPVRSLLVTLVDSGYTKTPQYETYFSKLFFDAKIELKKQRAKDEKQMEAENSKSDDNDDDNTYSYDDRKNSLDDYAQLLMPFYDKNPGVPKFFDNLLASKDEDLQLNTAVLMINNNKPVPAGILVSLASKDRYSGPLYTALDNIHHTEKFPVQYKTQLKLARSYLFDDYKKVDSVVYLSKQTASLDDQKGTVYFFKYRLKKDDDWKIGISGLQPKDLKKVSSNARLTEMTDKKLKEDEPVKTQLQEQLKKIVYGFHKSAKNFFDSDNYYGLFKGEDE